MDIPIQDGDRAQLTRMQHVLEWLQMERVRQEAELRHTLAAGERMQAELMALLQRGYGIDAAHTVMTLDTERGVITTPDSEPG